MSKLNIVSAETGKVLNDNYVDSLRLGVSDQTLDAGAVKVGTGKSVVDIGIH